MKFEVLELPEVDSTSDYIKRKPDLWEKNNLVVFTTNQTSGRGQNKRTWVSQKGKDLAFSIIFHPDENLELAHLPCLNLYVALALVRVLREMTRMPLKIKWPNDVRYAHPGESSKKLAGILCELLMREEKPIVLIGVGINVNSTSYPKQIAQEAASLRLLMQQKIDVKNLLYLLWAEIRLLLESFKAPLHTGFKKEVHQVLDLLGESTLFLDKNMKEREGVVMGIDSLGLLVIKDPKTGETYKIDHNAWLGEN